MTCQDGHSAAPRPWLTVAEQHALGSCRAAYSLASSGEPWRTLLPHARRLYFLRLLTLTGRLGGAGDGTLVTTEEGR